MFADKTIMVTGGTGSFGNTFIRRIVEEDEFKQVIVFSRDEKKQHDMRVDFNNPKIKFFIGDVREKDSLIAAMQGVDFVFHAAALKHVPSCEFFPMEAVKTNILGSDNVLEAAELCNVKKVVVLCTDKAVYPINVMGLTKSLMEKLMLTKSKTVKSETAYCGVRYGNVIYSRGSVIPLFVKQIKEKKKITITNPDMTRFLLPLPYSVDLVLHAMTEGKNSDIFVKKAPAVTIGDLARACLNIFQANNEIKTIGIREGEKMHETLTTQEELIRAEESDEYYRITPEKNMNYDQYFIKGHTDKFPEDGYNSENAERLSIKKTAELLLSIDEIKQELKLFFG